jgi:hypothetical protein
LYAARERLLLRQLDLFLTVKFVLHALESCDFVVVCAFCYRLRYLEVVLL